MSALADLIEAVISLDMILTGKTRSECLHTSKSLVPFGVEEFATGELYYLSDGGYSRINIVVDSKTFRERLQLCIGARAEVAEQWNTPLAMEAREKVENVVIDFIDDSAAEAAQHFMDND